jgi:hypothetical protein
MDTRRRRLLGMGLTLFEPALATVWDGQKAAQQMVTELTPQVTQLLADLKREFGGRI